MTHRSLAKLLLLILSMHLLSHYYFDRNHASPYFKLGVLFPDLIPDFNRKIRRAVFAQVPVQDNLYNLYCGIRKHYQADALFHNSELFRELCATIKTQLLMVDISCLRKRAYFLAHIFLELLLDRRLIKLYPALPVSMYDDLQAVRGEEVAAYLCVIGRQEISTDFLHNFNRFSTARHLIRLPDNEFFIAALLRIYSRVNPVEVNWIERDLLMALTENVEGLYTGQLDACLEQMRKRLEPGYS
ncbi:MAG: hypothetical protein KatS3mg031_1870 [Chitinophagales bacterium]|nr:MAG: hypothetical protein KatS3mg031_1870 [Chitinophagales bacterium]